MHYTCLIIIHDPGMRLGQESKPATFGLGDECSTTELTLLLYILRLDNRRQNMIYSTILPSLYVKGSVSYDVVLSSDLC